jgi:2-polyprenyl-6-methoxyphenol hydroxylase-like FAD-dependent oxidoreductase
MLDILVCGGGIGGCAAALALHRQGNTGVRIIEAVTDVQPLGVGINLQASGVLALHELGLREQLEATAIQTRQLNYYTGPGGKLIISDPRGLHAGYKVPQYSIHRGHLQMILFDAAKQTLGPEGVVVGRRLVSFATRESDGKVEALFELLDEAMVPTGEQVLEVCDVLIGADGIKSAVRQQLYPDDEIQYSGLMLWRATTTLDTGFLGGDTMFMAGTNEAKLVAYPISREAQEDGGRSVINWIAETYLRDYDPDTFGYSTKASKEQFAHLYDDWHGDGFWSKEAAARGEGLDIAALIDGAEEIFAYPMVDRDPVDKWSFGCVTLLGDAAHAMRPNGSNGATQAILDGVALARLLAPATMAARSEGALPDRLAAALVEYEQERLEPTTRVVMANRSTGPERVLQMVVDDADTPFGELEAVIAEYRKLAGFDQERVNARYDEWTAEQQAVDDHEARGRL